jgi:hypothetical protein
MSKEQHKQGDQRNPQRQQGDMDQRAGQVGDQSNKQHQQGNQPDHNKKGELDQRPGRK